MNGVSFCMDVDCGVANTLLTLPCVPRCPWKALWVLMNVYLCSAKGVLYVSLVGCRYRVLYLFLSGSSGICFSLYWVKEELSTISLRQGFPYIYTLCSSQGPVLLGLV